MNEEGMKMKINIIFDSRYGNGRKVIEYLAGNLIGNGHEVIMNLVKESEPKDIEPADIYIFASPTHARRATRRIRKFIKKMEFPARARYVCMTTYSSKTFAVPGMCEMLDNKGITQSSKGLEIKVIESKGPLESGWEKKIDKLIEKLN